jgi:hypothetical protein
VEDRPGGEQVLGRAEGRLDGPQLDTSIYRIFGEVEVAW